MEGKRASGLSAYVAGRGAVSAFGIGREALFDGVFSGRSAIRPRERLAEVVSPCAVAAELPRETLTRCGTPLVLGAALAAAREALSEASLVPDERCGLVLATTKADLEGGIAPARACGRPWRLLAELAEHLGMHGPTSAVSCACASGLAALALGGRWLRSGRATRVLVVGADVLNEFIFRGFASLLALAPGPCQPFTPRRAGLSLGEGAGAILLSAHASESLGARLLSAGASNDANHLTGPSRDGSGLALAIERALAQAALAPEAIDYAHLHGTGTDYNDAMECKALRRVFPVPPAASGSKAQLGHTLGAAGLLESLITLEALTRALAPPNVGLMELDPELGLSLHASARPLARARTALKLAAGFGGINVALVFARSG
jgi:3-oxoacyl-(acyl-carrier-protein) synthase